MRRSPRPTVTLVCQQCAASFSLARSDAEKPGRGKFCSRVCVGASQRKGLVSTRTCQRCSKQFEMQPHRVVAGRGYYCSAACRKTPLPTADPNPERATVKPKSPSAKSRPTTLGPNRDNEPLSDKGGPVRCAGPVQPPHTRPFGVMCQRCEWRAFEQPAREGVA
jgi:hypothetical protein